MHVLGLFFKHHQQENIQQQYTAGMRRIDLISVIASPMMAGLLMTLGSKQVAVVGILPWSLLAWWPECRLLRLAQQFSPHLR